MQRSWNSRFSGKVAGFAKESRGKHYVVVKIMGDRFFAHRIAFIHHVGSISEELEVDHIDGNGLNNSISNLRIVTKGENARNQKRYNNNESGTVGVSYSSLKSKWVAQIGYSGRVIHLGYFNKKEYAIEARKLAEIKYGYHKNHGSDRPL